MIIRIEREILDKLPSFNVLAYLMDVKLMDSDIIEGFRTKSDTFGDGNYYTLPFLRSTEVLYYNETFFTEHNLTVPQTWEDLWTTCAKIKEIDPKCTPLGYDSEANFFITLSMRSLA